MTRLEKMEVRLQTLYDLRDILGHDVDQKVTIRLQQLLTAAEKGVEAERTAEAVDGKINPEF